MFSNHSVLSLPLGDAISSLLQRSTSDLVELLNLPGDPTWSAGPTSSRQTINIDFALSLAFTVTALLNFVILGLIIAIFGKLKKITIKSFRCGQTAISHILHLIFSLDSIGNKLASLLFHLLFLSTDLAFRQNQQSALIHRLLHLIKLLAVNPPGPRIPDYSLKGHKVHFPFEIPPFHSPQRQSLQPSPPSWFYSFPFFQQMVQTPPQNQFLHLPSPSPSPSTLPVVSDNFPSVQLDPSPLLTIAESTTMRPTPSPLSLSPEDLYHSPTETPLTSLTTTNITEGFIKIHHRLGVIYGDDEGGEDED